MSLKVSFVRLEGGCIKGVELCCMYHSKNDPQE